MLAGIRLIVILRCVILGIVMLMVRAMWMVLMYGNGYSDGVICG